MTKTSPELKRQKVSRNSFNKDCSLGSVGGSKIDANSSLLGHDELSSKNGKGSNKVESLGSFEHGTTGCGKEIKQCLIHDYIANECTNALEFRSVQNGHNRIYVSPFQKVELQ